ncbi:metallophosphoesterase [Pseudoalteromonas sp. T1lg75]|uniref:metallophosphoesterase n=1 Tax=Pseudoalteromonas sp. T1lg75 TaxID=2077102 RepID=UPI000CF6E534|nr:metallophosphoesterase [Pseudoalteromonas sp. T1lg75]
MKYTALLLGSLLCAAPSYAQPSFLVKPYLQNPATDAMSIFLETTDTNVQLHYRAQGSDTYQVMPMEKISSVSSIYSARITGLTSDTKYEYYVSTNGGSSNGSMFKTWPDVQDDLDSFKFVSFSDSQGQHVSRLVDIVDNGIVRNDCENDLSKCVDNIAGIVIPGDLVQNGGTISQWREQFFGAAGHLFSQVPVIPAIGNHDTPINNYLNYFELPDNGYSDYQEQWYVHDYLNLRIITLNSNTSKVSDTNNVQRAWLDALLEDTANSDNIDYVMLQIHHPCKSELWTPGEKQLTCEYVDKFEQVSARTGKITGHIFGHTHAYSRGQSRDVSHLWLNAAVSSGDIDYWGEFPNFDYDEFQKSYPEYGYSTLVFAVDQMQMHVKRYSGGDGKNNYWGYQGEGVRDDFTVGGSNLAPEQPQAVAPVDTAVKGVFELTASQYIDTDEDAHLESHWQVSSDPQFETVELDIWGNTTRAENIWHYANTQEGVALNSYKISTQLPSGTYFWRVRYRDAHWAWSQWSENVSFEVDGLTFSDNLIVNGGAEQGLSHWSIEKGVVEANASDVCSGVTAQSGQYYFAVGGICEHSDVGQLAQEVALTDFSDYIAAGVAKLELSAFVRNYNGNDVPELWVDIYDSERQLITSSEVISNASGAWNQVSTLATLPTNAAFATVRLKGTRKSGTDNDSYFDQVKLVVGYDSSGINVVTTDNLILNPEADLGLEHWQIEAGVVEALASGQCNGVSANAGDHYFAVGGLCAHSAVGQAAQSIALDDYARVIEQGKASISLSASMRDWSGDDIPEVWVDVFDANNQLLGSSQRLSNASNAWQELSTAMALETSAASLTVRMKGTRNKGTDNDSYIDSLQLTLSYIDSAEPNTPPTAVVDYNSEVFVGDTVSVNGAGSFDEDQGPENLSFLWMWANRPADSVAELSDMSSAAAVLTPDVPGIYHLTLQVSDGEDVAFGDVVISAQPPVLCDLNRDTVVNKADIGLIRDRFGAAADKYNAADANKDGVITGQDLSYCVKQCSQSNCKNSD